MAAPQRPSYPPTPDDWQRHREIITRLYASHTLPQTKEILRQQNGFRATAKQWSLKISRWHLDKKVKRPEMKAVLRIARSHQSAGLPPPKFRLRGKVIDVHRAREYFRRKGLTEEDILDHATSPAASTPEDLSLMDPLVRPTAYKVDADEQDGAAISQDRADEIFLRRLLSLSPDPNARPTYQITIGPDGQIFQQVESYVYVWKSRNGGAKSDLLAESRKSYLLFAEMLGLISVARKRDAIIKLDEWCHQIQTQINTSNMRLVYFLFFSHLKKTQHDQLATMDIFTTMQKFLSQLIETKLGPTHEISRICWLMHAKVSVDACVCVMDRLIDLAQAELGFEAEATWSMQMERASVWWPRIAPRIIAETEVWMRRLLPKMEENYGASSERTLWWMCFLASKLVEQTRLDEAMQLAHAVLERCEWTTTSVSSDAHHILYLIALTQGDLRRGDWHLPEALRQRVTIGGFESLAVYCAPLLRAVLRSQQRMEEADALEQEISSSYLPIESSLESGEDLNETDIENHDAATYSGGGETVRSDE